MTAWERREGESARAYEAAALYFGMGAGRSLERVAEACGKSPSLIGRWSARHGWGERAAAYDAHLAGEGRAARERAARARGEAEVQLWAGRLAERREREWRLSEALLAKAEAILAAPLGPRSSPRDAAALVDLAVRLTRFLASEGHDPDPGAAPPATVVEVEYIGGG